MTLVEMYHRIKQYQYANGLEDLKVYSKQYSSSILLPAYSKNKNLAPYTLLSMDFNHLFDINAKYGKNVGDKVIYQYLSHLIDILPSGSCVTRTGGDEFSIIIPIPYEDTKNYASSILAMEKDFSALFYGCTTTMHFVDSTKHFNLQSMLKEGEQQIASQKVSLKEKDNCIVVPSMFASNSDFYQSCYYYFQTFFKSLRLHNDVFTLADLKNIYLHCIDVFHDLLEKNARVRETDSPVYLPHPKQKLFHEFHTQLRDCSSVDEKQLAKILENDHSSTLQKLICEPVTGEFSKDYLQQYLLKEQNASYRAVLLSSTFIKLNNLLYGHDATDKDINYLAKQCRTWMERISSPLLSHPSNPFTSVQPIHLISLGGGDFLVTCPANYPMENLELEHFIHSVQNEAASPSLLKLSISPCAKNINAQNLKASLEDLFLSTYPQKDTYVKDLLRDSSKMDILLQKLFSPVLQDKSRSLTTQEKKQLLDIFSYAGLSTIEEFNRQQLSIQQDEELQK